MFFSVFLQNGSKNANDHIGGGGGGWGSRPCLHLISTTIMYYYVFVTTVQYDMA